MSSALEITFKVLFSVVFATNLVGNTLVILVVSLHRKMQTPMNWLLANLALADLFIGLFFIPRTLFSDLYTHPGGLVGDILCKTLTYGNFSYLAAVASIMTLMFIAWERFNAVMHPHSSRARLDTKKIRLAVATTWVAAFIFDSFEFWIIKFDEQQNTCIYDWPVALWQTDVVLWCIGLGLVPLGIEAGLYSRVVYRLWGENGQTVEISQRSLMQQRKRLTKVVVTITVINTVLWLPIYTYYFVECFAGLSVAANAGSWAPVFFTITHLMVVLNASLNPMIYAAQDRSFRRHVWWLLKSPSAWKGRVIPEHQGSSRVHRLTVRTVTTL